MQAEKISNSTFELFSDFMFAKESPFLRKKYNYGNLPVNVVQKIYGFVCEYDKIEAKCDDSADVEMREPDDVQGGANKRGEEEVDPGSCISSRLEVLCTMSAVSKGWYNALNTTYMWAEFIKYELELSTQKAYLILLSMEDGGNFDGMDSNGRERFSMLRETLREAHRYLKTQSSTMGWKDVRTPSLSYTLLKNFRKTIENIQATCKVIFSHVCEMTCNFDILELTLRKGLYELRSMLPTAPGTDETGANRPLTSRSDPRVTRVITDPDARSTWEARIGSSRACVDFKTFYNKVIIRDFPCANNPRFAKLLSYHLNFPVSDIVTSYRFRTLVSEFGPYQKFAENFDRYALRPGFVGFMNTVKAEEILVMHYNKTPVEKKRNTVLIRYSRKQPDVLAFTSLDVGKKKIEHRRNVYRDGTPIPIGIFVEQHFSGFDLLPMGIDDDVITCPNIFKLANLSRPYYRYVEDF